jgi:hypothetical protein
MPHTSTLPYCTCKQPSSPQRTRELPHCACSIDDKYKSVILAMLSHLVLLPSLVDPPVNRLFLLNCVAISTVMRCLPMSSSCAFELEPDPTPDEAITGESLVDEADPEPSDTLLINATKGSHPNPLPPGDICRVLSKNSKHSANLTHIEYKVS